MQYPNAVHFAFVPAIVEFTQVIANIAGIRLELTAGEPGAMYRDERSVGPDRSCVFDIRRALQMLFVGTRCSETTYDQDFVDSPLYKTISVAVYAISESNETSYSQTVRITAIWGGISVGESSGGVMHRRWFVDYPFTLDVFARKGTSFDIMIDGKQPGIMFYNHREDYDGATPYHRYLMNPAKILDPESVEREVHIVIPHSLVLQNDRERVGLMAYTLTIDRCTMGVYLRWIDRQGRYCYYLFRDQGTAAAVSVEERWVHNEMSVPTAYENGVNVGIQERRQMACKSTRSLGARLVDSETFDFLLTLAQSVVVDEFDGYDQEGVPLWHRVNVVAASYTKTTKHLQDFSFSIEEPTAEIQTL